MVISYQLPGQFDSGQTIQTVNDAHLWAHTEDGSGTLNPPMPVVYQPRGTEWCWAVVTTSMHNHLDNDDLSACDLVERVRPGNSCCADPTSQACRGPDEVALHLHDLGNAREGPLEGGVDWRIVTREIANNRPIGAIVSYPGGAHAVVICGWVVTEGKRFLILMDPQSGPVGVGFGTFQEGYPEDGRWRETNLTKRSGR